MNYPGVPSSNRGFSYPVGGINSVPEYMPPGFPFSKQFSVITGSTTKVDFPMVTNEVYVKNNSSGTIAVGWTNNGCLGNNRYTLKGDQDITFKVRIKTLYLLVVTGTIPSEVDVSAGLTQIPKHGFPVLTGSMARSDGYLGSYSSGSTTFGQQGYDGIG